MSKKELRRYQQSGSGLIEIGALKAQGTWIESGLKAWHYAGSMRGGDWVEGLIESVAFEIAFPDLTTDQSNALASLLDSARRDEYMQFTVLLGGKRLDCLYLHDVRVDDDNTPRGLVFSNNIP